MAKILTVLLACISSLCSAQLRLNEFSAHDGLSINGETTDWIEITNVGTNSIQLSDYFLSDDLEEPLKWQLPVYSIQPSEILLLAASGEDITQLGNHWEALVLSNNTWAYTIPSSTPPNYWHELSFEDSLWETAAGGFGYGDDDDNTQIPEGSFSVYQRVEIEISTLEGIESLELHADYDDGFVAYLNGTEVARSFNVSGNPPEFDQGTSIDHEADLYQGNLPEVFTLSFEDLVEGTNVLAIQTLNIDNNSSDFSSNYFLLAEFSTTTLEHQPVPDWFDEGENSGVYFHTNFKLKTGEHLVLSDSESNVVDNTVVSEDLRLGLTKGRSPDGVGEWCYFNSPSPAESNGASWCFNGVAEPPSSSHPSGWYTGELPVSAAADGVIRYSLNGDYPVETDPVFSSAEFSQNTSLSLRTFSSENLLPSEVVDRTYIFSETNYNLPVFSIHTDEDGLFDYNNGIYEFGPNANLNDFPYFGSNFWEPWSRFARLEYFNPNQELEAEEHLDLEIHGGWSRAYSQKSFRLDFKSLYTGDLEIPLFDKKPWIEEVNNIIFSDLAHDLHLDNMAYEGCLLYINGEFWGVYGIREKIDEHYVEVNHGVDNDDVDLMNSFGVLEGSGEHFYESVDVLLGMSANSPMFYAEAVSRFDLENYMDYFIAQTYYQNQDWMGIAWGANNIKLWRPQTEDGKWRYVMYDTDAGFGHFWGIPEDDYLSFAREPSSPNNHSELFDKLLENEQFKCEFAQRYADVVNTVFQPESFNSVADGLRDNISEAMPLQIMRWNESLGYNDWLLELEDLKTYNSERIEPARSHVNSNLNLGGQVVISVNVLPEGSGEILINTIQPDVYPWTGVYFNGCPVEISAVPNEGYTFTSWLPNQEFSDSLSSDVILSNLTGNTTFTAVFDSDTHIENVVLDAELKISPNPSHGQIELTFTSLELEHLDISVVNQLGQLVWQSHDAKQYRTFVKSINLSTLTSGIYTVRVLTQNGTVSRKIVIE